MHCEYVTKTAFLKLAVISTRNVLKTPCLEKKNSLPSDETVEECTPTLTALPCSTCFTSLVLVILLRYYWIPDVIS